MTEMNAVEATTPSDSTQSIESNPEIVAAFDKMAGNSEATATTEPAVGDEAGTESAETQQEVAGQDQNRAGQQQAKPAPPPDPIASLDPALRHAARRAGWSEQELRDFVTQANPAVVDSTLTRLHQSYNDMSTRFAQLGQQRPQQQQQPPTPQQSQRQPTAHQSPFDAIESAFSDEGVAKLREEYGDNLVEQVISPLRDLVQPLRQMQDFIVQQKNEAIAREVDVAMKELAVDFGDIYGKPGETPTMPQTQLRQQLFAVADQILVGAHAQGLPMSTGEAIERANMILSAPTSQARERKKIASSVKERSRQFTQRPTQRLSPPAPAGEKAAEAALQEKWNAMNNRR
jgi:hypothetical protein